MSSGLTRGWIPVRVKKTHQIKNIELRFLFHQKRKGSGSIRTAALTRRRAQADDQLLL
jgi:hypothetical protein